MQLFTPTGTTSSLPALICLPLPQPHWDLPQQLCPYLVQDEFDLNVVFPEVVSHQHHVLVRHGVVLTHSNHPIVPEHLLHLPP